MDGNKIKMLIQNETAVLWQSPNAELDSDLWVT